MLCFIAGVMLYVRTGSSLCLVFGVENSVDFISSVIVLWRFFVPADLTEAVEKKLEKREERASVAISIIMGFLGIGILIAAIDDFMQGEDEPAHRELILAIAFFSILCSGTMALYKFNYAVHLGSPSLRKDGLCSLIGAVLGAALFFNTLIQNQQPGLWWIDPVVSLICGFVALFMSAQSLYIARVVDKLPIFSAHWWSVDIEEGGDGNTPAEEKPKESDIV
ncbi:Transmembrane protein 16.3 [Seminavis robusta]|uniref:Transmembrane protein 16.3 n=1 Tax=Seminavis robusta TaxID=568900 RepID=A0A9N8ENE0_9STRA|nr:Transmembrane protein 16.3 [Seminavis robusta]|eukprot:Sro1618_g286400.1 Transmembrane protein 16.3 (222) ;mRNA; r:7116-7947